LIFGKFAATGCRGSLCGTGDRGAAAWLAAL
jgi:hypothetical protein